MDFLFKDRGSGKRTIKPSKDSEALEAVMGAEESDDSDFEVEKHKVGGSDSGRSDSGGSSDGSGSGSGSDDDGSDDGSEDEEDGLEGEAGVEGSTALRANMTTEELLALARERAGQGQQGLGQPVAKAKVCGTCLGEGSDHTNEIVECDGCGVAVHEACYGIQESGSLYSNTGSAASTEPWFCEPCMAGVCRPDCEVCPRIGGIYKETDVGTWIHLVCALYVPQISFFDQDRITKATLFELNYQAWGKRTCTLCKDVKMARTGLCIECDAGMCRQYFHVSCAQEAGLLSEPSDSDSEQFFGHCRAHTQKETLRKRKRNYLTHQLHFQARGASIAAELGAGGGEGGPETARQRIMRKLRRCQDKWQGAAKGQGDSWVPTQKMPRLLLTSSKAVRKLLRKNVLHGWSQTALDQEAHSQRVVQQIRRRWGVAPAWSVEFVAYYHDREDRLAGFHRGLATSVLEHSRLVEQDGGAVSEYRARAAQLEREREAGERLRRQTGAFRGLLARYDPLGRGLEEGATLREAARSQLSPRSGRARAGREVRDCGSCRLATDQHLLAHCLTCDQHYHLACLTPPLAKMPRSTKQYSWQCSECELKAKVGSFDVPVQVDTSAPRASRARIPPPPDQLTSDSDSAMILSPPSTSRPRAKPGPKPGSRGRGKRPRTNVSDGETEAGPSKVGRVEARSPSPAPTPHSPSPAPPARSPPSAPPPSLPAAATPKKFFKSRDQSAASSASEPASSDGRNFKEWLETKLSPGPRPQEPPPAPPARASPPASPPHQPASSPHRPASPALTNGTTAAGDARYPEDADVEAGSSDEDTTLSPEKAGDLSLGSAGGARGVEPGHRGERTERKRAKREEKERRREERRKKKHLMKQQEQQQEIAGEATNDEEEGPGEDMFEEDEDGNCVIRITPKPVQPMMKLKIKPIMRPEQEDPPAPVASYPMMHPKKKVAHMEQEAEVPVPAAVEPAAALNGLQEHWTGSSPGRQAVTSTTSDLPPAGPPGPRTNGNGVHSPAHSSTHSSTSAGPAAGPAPSGKRGWIPGGRDPRTSCDVCRGEGSNANLVRCDECRRCYHFSCLLPPVRKSPKKQGWAWSCSDCAPSGDEDKGWHL